MIINTSYKKPMFLRAIAKHFGDGTYVEVERGVWYFGAGYWRGAEIEDMGDLAIVLQNSDFTREQIQKVEEAISIIERLHYQ